MRKITIIGNPISGGRENKQRVIEQVAEFFSKDGATCTVKLTGKRGDATTFARDAAVAGQDLVIAIGGDGTVNEAATGLVGSETALAVVPRGSGNGFARTLGMPMSVAGACQAIANGRVATIDAGQVNDRFFFLVAGVGFDAAVGQQFDNHPRRGPLTYFYLSAREFVRYKPEQLEISFDHEKHVIEPFVVAVANGRQYGNNACIAPDALLDDGLFNLVIVHRLSVPDVFTQVPKLFTGKISSFPAAEFAVTESVVIKRAQPGFINLDGEAVREERDLRLSVLPRSLKIIAPKDSRCLSQ